MATITVTTLDDIVGADGEVSLREAIEAANTNAAFYEAGAGDAGPTVDRIVFDPSLSGTLRLSAGELTILDTVEIDGGGAITITGDANGDDVTLAGTDITDVAATLASGDALTDGLDNDGDGFVDGADLDGETLLGDNTRILNVTSASATTTLVGLTLTGGYTNGTAEGGGAVRTLADLIVEASTISGNGTAGDSASGGGIYGDGAVTLTSSTLSGNSTAGNSADGGGIFGYDVTLTNSTVSGNSTTGFNADGGGIHGYDVALTNSTVSGNSTAGVIAQGGGIYGRGDVTLTDSTVSGNSTAGDSASGGGIYGDGAVTLTNSTLSGNSTAGIFAEGGGIFGYDVTLTNSTVSGNSTTGVDADGGGIHGYDVALTNSTVSGNSTAGVDAQGGGINSRFTADLANSIVLGNVATSSTSDEILVILGTPIYQGLNIVGGAAPGPNVTDAAAADVFQATFDNNGVDAGVLADNGGPVATIALKAHAFNPALDSGDDSLLGGIVEDARGRPRPADFVGKPDGPFGSVDLGAFELQSAVAGPQSLLVTTLDDELDSMSPDATVDTMGGSDDLSLREAVFLANLYVGGTDGIAFDASLQDGTIRLTLGEIEITDTVEIDGGTVGITITGDANGDDVTLAGTDITDVAATLASGDALTDGLDNDGDGLIDGADLDGETLLDDNSRILNVTSASATTTLVGLTLTGGYTNGIAEGGGAVRTMADLMVEASTISGNGTAGDAASGGGIYGDGAVTLTSSTLSGNSTAGNSADGGGIFGYDVTLTNSTLSGNSTTGFNADGGGIHGYDVALTNSTVSGNSTAGIDAQGGGINSRLTAHLENSIVLGNVATSSTSDEILMILGPPIYQGLNIVGGATPGPNVIDAAAADVFQATFDNNGVDAGVLADNGGPVETVALLSSAANPALDSGDDTLLGGISSDARGEPRPVDLAGVANGAGGYGDLGAFELQSLVVGPQYLVVTTLDDELDSASMSATVADMGGAGDLSLREAVFLTNLYQGGTDGIAFDASLQDGTIRLTLGEIEITDTVEIDGGTVGITITGDANADDVTLAGTDITDVAATLASGDALTDGFDNDGDGLVDGADLDGETLLDDNSRIFKVTDGSATTALIGLTLTGGHTSGEDQDGGAVYSLAALAIENSDIVGNSTSGGVSTGGGLFVVDDLSVLDSTIAGNRTTGDGSAGGGAFVGGETTVTSSTVSGNATLGVAAPGGGMTVGGLQLLDSTVADNATAGDASVGGGIFNASAEAVTLLSSTVTGNSTAGDAAQGAGIFGDAELTNSIVLGNVTVYAGVGDDEISGSTTYLGLNIVGGATPGPNVIDAAAAVVFQATFDNNGVDAGALADNGGPVETVALLSSAANPALDSGDEALLGGLAVDARGLPRLVEVFSGSASDLDLGAYELQAPLAAGPLSLTVTTLDDELDSNFLGATLADMGGAGDLSLREAVFLANYAAGGVDAIDFDVTLQDGTIRLTLGEIEITDTVIVDGEDRNILVTGDANDDDTTDAEGITDVAASAGALSGNSRIFNITDASAETTLIGLTLTGGYTSGNRQEGGAIRSEAELTLENATVSGNSTAGYYAYGGGVFGTTVTLANSTVSGNSTAGFDAYGGGIYARSSVTLSNSIVLGNVTSYAGVGDDEISGSTTYLGLNIVGGATPGPNVIDAAAADVFQATFDNNGVDAGVLADNGGPVATVALNAGAANPALDSGDDTLLGGISSDARGEPRPVDLAGVANGAGGYGDLGAFELQSLGATAPQTFLVTTLDDELDSTLPDASVASMGAYLSLREAVFLANHSGFADTIEFDAGLQDGLIRLSLGELEIVQEVTIDGADRDITITGDALGNDVADAEGITDVAATLASGDALTDGLDNDGDGLVDGADLDGETLLGDNSRIFNVTDASAATTLIGLTLTGGYTSGNDEGGGAIRSAADLTLEDSRVSGNATAGQTSFGGGIYAKRITSLTDVEVSGNSTSGQTALGGGIAGSDSYQTTLTRTTVSGNSTAGDGANGGGIFAGGSGTGHLLIVDSVVSGNSTSGDSAIGGGIQAGGAGDELTILGSTISGNSTSGIGAVAGGILTGGYTVIRDSTVSGNFTLGESATGGGILSGAAGGDLLLVNVTVSGNSTAGENAAGGGIIGNTSMTLTNSTVSGNATAGENAGGGGIIMGGVGDIVLSNSIVLGNLVYNPGLGDDEIVPNGQLLYYGLNIVGEGPDTDGSDGVVNAGVAAVFAATQEIMVDTDADGIAETASGVYAGAIADNGGPVETVALKFDAANPALDSGDESLLGGLATDARGLPRLVEVFSGSASDLDLGAYELQAAATAGPLSLTVTTLDDELDSNFVGATLADMGGATDLSLREAVFLANYASGGTDTIDFDASLQDGLIRLTLGEIEITDTVIVDGSGRNITVTGDALGDDVLVLGSYVTDVAASLSASIARNDGIDNDQDGTVDENSERLFDNNSRVFNVTDSSAATTLIGLTVTGGFTSDDNQGGGAIRSEADLTIEDSHIVGNRTFGDSSSGGGVFSLGELRVVGSTVSDNSTSGDSSSGGGILTGGGGAYAYIADSTVSGNSTSGQSSHGGGLLSGGDTVILSTTVSGNATHGASSLGGGMLVGAAGGDLLLEDSTVSDNSTAGDFGFGGGIAAGVGGGDTTVVNSTVSGNTTTGLGSSGAGVSAGGGGGAVTVSSSTLTGNSTTGDSAPGGGLYSPFAATLTDSIVLGNVTAYAGVGGDEISGSTTYLGLNIVGEGADSDGTDGVINAAATEVFAWTEEFHFDGAAPTGVIAGKLANNGGPVETVALRGDPGNPALDVADDLLAPASDARGVVRPIDLPGAGNAGSDTGDLGAFELQTLAAVGPQVFVVTTLDDELDSAFFEATLADMGGAGDLSLREALHLANNNGNAGDLDRIEFDSGLAGATLVLTQGALVVRQDVEIDGDVLGDTTGKATGRADDITITAADVNTGFTDLLVTPNGPTSPGQVTIEQAIGSIGDSRLFEIREDGTDAVFNALTLTGGGAYQADGTGPFGFQLPGADGFNMGAAIYQADGSYGAIYNRSDGSSVVSQTGNPAPQVAGSLNPYPFVADNPGMLEPVIRTTVEITNSTITDNFGGAILSGYRTVIEDSIVSGNDGGFGAAVTTGVTGSEVTLTDVDLVDHDLMTASTTLGTASLFSYFKVYDSTIADNRQVDTLVGGILFNGTGAGVFFSGNPGGGISITDSEVSGNQGVLAGVIATGAPDTDVTLVRSNFTDNVGRGDLLAQFSAGVLTLAAIGADVYIVDSAFVDNQNVLRGGGAIALGGTSNLMDIVNSTFTGNVSGAPLGGGAGAISNLAKPNKLSIVNSTIVGNEVVEQAVTDYRGLTPFIDISAADDNIANTGNYGEYSAGGVFTFAYDQMYAFNGGNNRTTIVNTVIAGNQLDGEAHDFTINPQDFNSGLDFLTFAAATRDEDTGFARFLNEEEAAERTAVGDAEYFDAVLNTDLVIENSLIGTGVLLGDGTVFADDGIDPVSNIFGTPEDPALPLVGNPTPGANGVLVMVPLYGSPLIDAGSNAFLSGVNTAPDGSTSGTLTTDAAGLPRAVDLDGDGVATVNIGASEADSPAQALVVTTLDDELDDPSGVSLDDMGGAGDLSLREAVHLANTAQGGPDLITFDASLAGGFIRLVQGEIAIGEALTIDGSGLDIVVTGDSNADDTTLAGTPITDVEASAGALADNSRIFNVTDPAAETTLIGLTLTGGYTGGDNLDPADSTYSGGAVRSEAALTLEDSWILGNATAGVFARGGGVFGAGDVEVIDSTVGGNRTSGDFAGGGGLWISGNLSATGSTVRDNAAANSPSSGGGIQASGLATLTDSTVSGNSSFGPGGGIRAGAVMLTNVTVSGNATTGNTGQGGGVYSTGSLTVINSTVSGNRTEGGSAEGGGLAGAGAVTISNSIVLGNLAENAGPGVDEIYASPGLLGFGGANLVGATPTAFDASGYAGAENADPTAVFAGTVHLVDELGYAVGAPAGLLADNGGPVQTIALLADSDNPALDAGDDGLAPAADARGEARPFNAVAGTAGDSDLGAYELQTVAINLIQGDVGDNLLVGTDIADHILGYGGADTIQGLDGDDLIEGGSGNDDLDGGAGDDTISGLRGRDVIHGGTGRDTVSGEAANDRIFGQGGADTLDGGSGNDLVRGGSGNDTILGGKGRDQLFGGDGDDVIEGGIAKDRLSGGSGVDSFVFRQGDGEDTIVDFLSGTDEVNLTGHAGISVTGDIGQSTNGTDAVADLGGGDLIVFTGLEWGISLFESDFQV